ncbi:MAG: hypothetical protein M1831_001223 [Alyxoria varia]|nr:MAG: hypothetical protein M1831_001223 [Alyxoria varia]
MGHKRKSALADHEDDEQPPKRKRTYTKTDAQLAKNYDQLSSNSPEDRIAATKTLLRLFSHDASNSEAASSDPPALKKVLTRLVRGLCSPRKAARVGYFMALAELLLAHSTSQGIVDSCVELVKSATEGEAGTKGQEKRDYEIGRAFGFHAILQSNVLTHNGARSKSKFEQLLEELLDMYEMKPWLREDIGKSVYDWVTTQNMDTVSHYSQPITNRLARKEFASSPEGIAIWLELKNKVPQENLPKHNWNDEKASSNEDIPHLAKMLLRKQNSMDSDRSPQQKSDAVGSRQVAPHFAWNVILQSFIREDEQRGYTGDAQTSRFAQFWEKGVDRGHFGSGTSPEKKYLGLRILEWAVLEAPCWSIQYSISRNILTWLLSQRSKSERYLNGAAKATLETLVTRSKVDNVAATAIITAFTVPDGPLSFEKFSGSSTVKSILSVGDENTAQNMAAILLLRLKEMAGLENAKTSRSNQQAAIDHLSGMIRDRHVKLSHWNDDFGPEWVSNILVNLAKYGCEVTSNKLSSEVREHCRSGLLACLGHLFALNHQTARLLPPWLACKIHQDHRQELSVYRDADEEVVKTLERAILFLKNEGATEGGSSSSRAFTLLTSMTLLQVYGGEIEAIETLLELDALRHGMKEKGASRKEALEATIDLILNLASRPSIFHRKLAEQVFAVFAADLTGDALQTMLDVLEQKEGLRGQTALFEQGDHASETEEAEDEDVSEDDDVELVHAEESAGNGGNDGQDIEVASNSSSSGASDSAASDSSEIARFDKALASTLKTSKPDTASKDEQAGDLDDDDGSSVSDTSMTDSQMLALEPHLTAIFKEQVAAGQINSLQDRNTRKKSKKKGSENKRAAAHARENIVNFKHRVLDLLDLWLKQHPSMPLTLDVIPPFLRLIRITRNKQIADKTIGILRAFYDSAKRKGLPLDPAGYLSDVSESTTSGDELLVLLDAMGSVHSEALKFASKAHASACSSASIFIARCMLLGVCRNQGSSEEQKQKIHTNRMREWRHEIDKLYSDTWTRALESTEKEKKAESSGMLPLTFWRDWQEWQIEVFVSRPANKTEEANNASKNSGKQENGQTKSKRSKKKRKR